MNSFIGPIEREVEYFVSRHSLPLKEQINPLKSLDKSVWLAYSLFYLIVIMTSFIILLRMKKFNGEYGKVLLISIFPSDTNWFKMAQSFLMIKLLMSFTFWTFNVLFGIDLWSVLITQTFETEVNSWEDINWPNSQFVWDWYTITPGKL